MSNEPLSLIDRTQRRVVCAAIRKNGFMALGPRHFDRVMHDQIGELPFPMRDAEEGFIDQWGRFMTREEAFEVASAAGQIRQKTGNLSSRELFSEDLY